MRIDLQGRGALVTGGTGAIGSAISLALARASAAVIAVHHPQDEAGAQVLRTQAQTQALPIETLALDVADAAAVSASLGALVAARDIDILVHAAGITRDAPLRRMSAEHWQQVLDVNLSSAFHVARALAEGMTQRGWGRIVNIASVNGQKGQFGQANYAASKAGLHGFTMALAQETARKGVTVNTVAPGYIDSPMIRAVPQDIRARILDNVPMNRFGDPQDVAAAVLFLCSPQAAYVTGAQLPVNGGLYMGH